VAGAVEQKRRGECIVINQKSSNGSIIIGIASIITTYHRLDKETYAAVLKCDVRAADC